jgi:hypothetical protein
MDFFFPKLTPYQREKGKNPLKKQVVSQLFFYSTPPHRCVPRTHPTMRFSTSRKDLRGSSSSSCPSWKDLRGSSSSSFPRRGPSFAKGAPSGRMVTFVNLPVTSWFQLFFVSFVERSSWFQFLRATSWNLLRGPSSSSFPRRGPSFAKGAPSGRMVTFVNLPVTSWFQFFAVPVLLRVLRGIF